MDLSWSPTMPRDYPNDETKAPCPPKYTPTLTYPNKMCVCIFYPNYIFTGMFYLRKAESE